METIIETMKKSCIIISNEIKSRNLLQLGSETQNKNSSNEAVKELDILRKRITYGIKHELIDLVRIRNVGRVRARILFKNGYKNRTTLKKVPLEKLAEIDKIGMTIAKSIKSQVEKVR